MRFACILPPALLSALAIGGCSSERSDAVRATVRGNDLAPRSLDLGHARGMLPRPSGGVVETPAFDPSTLETRWQGDARCTWREIRVGGKVPTIGRALETVRADESACGSIVTIPAGRWAEPT